MPGHFLDSVLGELEICYSGFLGRERRTGFILTSDSERLGYGHQGVMLRPLRPIPLLKRWWITRWLLDHLTKSHRCQRAYEEALVRERARHLANAKSILRRRGIALTGPEADRVVLIHGLNSARWHWRFEPTEPGYEVETSKRWPPSSSHTIFSHGDSVEDALTMALAAAIQEDERRLLPPRPLPETELHPSVAQGWTQQTYAG